MSILSKNGYDRLKEVVVGRELQLTKRLGDTTFQQFYKEAITEKVYQSLKDNDNVYYVNQDLIDIRNEQLDNLAQLLEDNGVIVHRPDKIDKIQLFKTPHFKSEVSSASNVRDMTLVYQDKIVETPTYVRNRYFENLALYDVFENAYRNGGQWIRCPHTKLSEDRMDLTHWGDSRDYENFDHSKYDMAIDGAQFLRLNNDCIVNVNSYNHYLGYLWVRSLFPDINFHMIHIADNHIDGAIVALREGTFLVDPKYTNIKEIMPSKFKDWEYLYPSDLSKNIDTSGMTDVDIQLASSRGMDINILSIDDNTVVVNERALGVIKTLEENGFKVLTIKLDNGEIFAGGIHCSTLDLVREDEFISY